MKILSDNNWFDMAKLIAFTTQKSTKVLIGTINPHETCPSLHSTFGTWIDKWTHFGIHIDTSVLWNTRLSPWHGNKFFRLQTHLHLPPLTIWAVYGSWYNLGNQNEDHYFVKSTGLVITGTDHNDIDLEQILSACHKWSWQANRFGNNYLWSHGTLS